MSSLELASPCRLVDEIGREIGSVGQALDEPLHVHPLRHLDAVHLQDVRLANAQLDEAVLTVGTDVGLLAGVRHAVQLQLGD